MTLEELRDASFWEHRICLDCTATFDASLEGCPVCGSDDVTRAEKILAIVEPMVE